MIILKIFLCIIVFLIIPELLGLLLTKFMNEKNSIILAFVVGYLLNFALFELIYLPMYFLGCSFRIFAYTYLVMILVLSIISIVINRKRFKEIVKYSWSELKSMPKMIIIFVILLCIQIYFPTKYMQHIDPDDAFYVAIVTTTLETNEMFTISPYTGDEFSTRQIRYCFSGLVIYFASISEFVHIHPTILCHTIWPGIAILLETAVYSLLGNKLFKGDKEKTIYFLIFLQIVYMFGFITYHTTFSFFAYRSWQGKALIGNFIIPVVWLLHMYCMENNKKVIYWLIFLSAMISSVFTTSMGVYLVPIEVGLLNLISMIQNRKLGMFIKSIVCLIPQVIVGVLYIILK